MDVHKAAGAPLPTLRLRHLRSRRDDPCTYSCDRGATCSGKRAHPSWSPDCGFGNSRWRPSTVPAAAGELGIRHIVALRGDPPPGADYTPHTGGYHYASDLVAGLKRVADFEISVAAYPETHPTARSADNFDLDNLKRKLDAGATRAITQYFFDTSNYLRFLERCLAAGITAPIVPGIMPVSNYAQAAKFSAMCGATVPAWLGHMFEGTEDDPEQRRAVASIVAAEQVRVLQANGIDEFHFYTLNRPELTYTIAHVLGVRPRPTGLPDLDAPAKALGRLPRSAMPHKAPVINRRFWETAVLSSINMQSPRQQCWWRPPPIARREVD